MMYLRYAVLTAVQLLFTGLSYVLAPVVALFCKADGYLPTWLAWFQTQDAPLDAGWQDGYFSAPLTPTGLRLWWLRVRWLWRNPAYGFCYWPLGLAYNPADWVIDTLLFAGEARAVLIEFRAHTRDGRYFAYTNSSGQKYGYKLWWALNADNTGLVDVLPASRGPDNRIPLCFTP